MAKKEKARSRYGEYCEYIDGELYGSVNIPLGGGRYRKERKRCSTKFEAKQWAMERLSGSRTGTIEIDRAMTFAELAGWYSRHYLVEPVFEKGIKVEGVRDWTRLRA